MDEKTPVTYVLDHEKRPFIGGYTSYTLQKINMTQWKISIFDTSMGYIFIHVCFSIVMLVFGGWPLGCGFGDDWLSKTSRKLI